MQEPSLLRFFVRCLFLLCVFLCRQLPFSLEVGIDRRMFLEAFSARIGEQGSEERSCMSDWPLGPDGLVNPLSDEKGEGRSSTPDHDQAPRSPTPPSVPVARALAFQRHINCYEFLARAIPAVPNVYPTMEGWFGDTHDTRTLRAHL